MFSKKILLYYFVILKLVYAANSDDLMEEFVRMLMDCTKEYPMTGDDIEQLKNRQLPDNENMRCLFACAYKSSGMMDDQGMLSVEGANNRAEEYLADDPEKLAKARDFTDACKSGMLLGGIPFHETAMINSNRRLFQCLWFGILFEGNLPT
ncbi:jg12573 [Pararge aegeria aegeria]|uniref:Jg12573 protein n=1 Tax=Pararge aegeria aegeria TaxID=348720 RepID=A0A8S4S753_9NEOP|nr:jg12573 [Pararge aegeria aegeria]